MTKHLIQYRNNSLVRACVREARLHIRNKRAFQAYLSYYQICLLEDSCTGIVSRLRSLATDLRVSLNCTPLVAVIIPAYNAADTIEASITSVIEQVGTSVLPLVVNDASDDQTLTVVRRLQGLQPLLGLLSLPVNRGSYFAVNVGLSALAHLPFTHFILHGADDVMNANKLSTQLSLLKQHNAQVCSSGYIRRCQTTNSVLGQSRNGHSMALFTKQVFTLLGYYDTTRFGGDSEYYRRAVAALGKSAVISTSQPLTTAFTATSNLTVTIPENSAIRQTYELRYKRSHSLMLRHQNFFKSFCPPVSAFPVPRLHFGNLHSIVGMATTPNRQTSALEAAQSLAQQVDRLFIYQNGFYNPDPYQGLHNVTVVSSLQAGCDKGDAGKFYFTHEKASYYFSADDDLIYPPDYIKVLTKRLQDLNNKCIITCHGRLMRPKATSFYKHIASAFRCLDNVPSHAYVHFGGTGVMGFYLPTFRPSFRAFSAPNMADIWVGLWARQLNVPIHVLEHYEHWLKYSDKHDHAQTIFSKYKRRCFIQDILLRRLDTRCVLTYTASGDKRLVSTERYVSSLRNQNSGISFGIVRKPRLAVLTCVYGRPEITKIFKKHLLSVEHQLSNTYTFLNIIVDSETSNEALFAQDCHFVYLNANNNPLSNKWQAGLTYLKDLQWDNLLILGSDDLMTYELLMRYQALIANNIDLIGLQDLYMYKLSTATLYYWAGYNPKHKRHGETIGLGRCLSRRLVSGMGYKLWDAGLQKNLDGNMMKNIRSSSFEFQSQAMRCQATSLAVDIKTEANVTSLEEFKDELQVIHSGPAYSCVKHLMHASSL